jgi:hypothetical protein
MEYRLLFFRILACLLLVSSIVNATPHPYSFFPRNFHTFGPKINWTFNKGSDIKFKSIGLEYSYWDLFLSPINTGVEYQYWPKKMVTMYNQIQGGLGLGVSTGPFYEFRIGEPNRSGIRSDLWFSFVVTGQLGYKAYFGHKDALYSGLLLKMPSFVLEN